jgi:hypothetical protein
LPLLSVPVNVAENERAATWCGLRLGKVEDSEVF